MKYIVPDYYEDFSCIAGECQHSCCIGWEIDIDEESYYRYQTIEGEAGNKIRSSISIDGDSPHYILGEDERCPFLRKDGLCQMIIDLGEDALCQICSDHPRFRNYYEDRIEIGLGLCCEAAGEIIIKHNNIVKLKTLFDDGKSEKINSEEQAILSFRDMTFEIMQDRKYTIDERLEELSELCGEITEKPIYEWAEDFLSLERLDEEWTLWLNILKENYDKKLEIFSTDLWQNAFEQLGIYFLYRHIPEAIYDGDIYSKIAFTILSVKILRQLCTVKYKKDNSISLEDLIEFSRMYSSEIEYSDENMDIIFNWLIH